MEIQSDILNELLLANIYLLTYLHLFLFLLLPDKHSGQKKTILAPVVIDQFVKQRGVLHELVQLSLPIELVVILGVEVLNGAIVDLFLVVLDNAEQAVGRQDLVGPQEVLRPSRFHQLVAEADPAQHFLGQAHTIVVRGLVVVPLEVILQQHFFRFEVNDAEGRVSHHVVIFAIEEDLGIF